MSSTKFTDNLKHPCNIPCYKEFSIACSLCNENRHVLSTEQKLKRVKSVFDTQVGGKHYKNKKHHVAKFCIENEYHAAESAVIKYIARHQDKNGIEDIKKAMHYLQMILELKYKIYSEVTYVQTKQ